MKEIIRINHSEEIGIMETMRVISYADTYIVQSFNFVDQLWVNQKFYDGENSGEKAVSDCYNWYCRNF